MKDLVNQLSNIDRYKIKTYIKRKICEDHKDFESNFIGLSRYLKHWNNSKQKLYKLLGNQFIVEKEMKVDIEDELEYKLDTLYHNSSLIRMLYNLTNRNGYSISFKKIYKDTKGIKKAEIETAFIKIYDDLCYCFDNHQGIINGTSDFSIKYKFPGHEKMLVISKGMKIMKKLKVLCDYFKNNELLIVAKANFDSNYTVEMIDKELEKLRLEHSVILNSKKDKVTFTYSIHPLDYMTMSDNANDWTSCMSLNEKGCYRQGTFELMNSNNVVMCYIKSSREMNINTKINIDNDKVIATKKTPSKDKWNSKNFRVFFVVTKDAIISGKSYPYCNNSYTKAALEGLRDLAKENLHWTYTYDIAKYKDMKNVYNGYRMRQAKHFARYDKKRNNKWTKKEGLRFHKIILETKAYYHDWGYNSNYSFWCVRNKVKHTKVITISGKTICPYCGGTIVKSIDYDCGDLCERADNVEYSLCGSCDDAVNINRDYWD